MQVIGPSSITDLHERTIGYIWILIEACMNIDSLILISKGAAQRSCLTRSCALFIVTNVTERLDVASYMQIDHTGN